MKQSDGIISTDPDFEDGAEPSAGVEVRQLLVQPDQHLQRLDKALAEMVPEFSRSYLQQLIEGGALQLDGVVTGKVSTRVRAGQRLTVEMRPTAHSQAFRPQPMALEVLFEDEHLLVLNKPAGLVVHPAPGNWSGTLLNGLLAHDPTLAEVPRAGIVHRLDKDTTGLMVVARSRPVMDALVRMIAAREVQRRYVALGHRAWTGARQQSAEWAIGRDPRQRLRMAAVDLASQAGKPARTDIECLDSVAQACWVRCTLHTGRTHQIRVHMMMLGHPLVGDSLYGGEAAAGLTRQGLHAYRLAFEHPVTGLPLAFHAPVPADLRQALDAWALGYNSAQLLS